MTSSMNGLRPSAIHRNAGREFSYVSSALVRFGAVANRVGLLCVTAYDLCSADQKLPFLWIPRAICMAVVRYAMCMSHAELTTPGNLCIALCSLRSQGFQCTNLPFQYQGPIFKIDRTYVIPPGTIGSLPQQPHDLLRLLQSLSKPKNREYCGGSSRQRRPISD